MEKKHKLTPRKKLIKELDALWSKVVKLRAGNKCQFCGRENLRLNSHHVHTRRRHATRWDITNGICLCFTHHHLMHNDAEEAMKFYHKLFTQEQWDKLKLKSHQIAKFSIADLEEIKDELKAKLKEYIEGDKK